LIVQTRQFQVRNIPELTADLLYQIFHGSLVGTSKSVWSSSTASMIHVSLD
jgi:hypothetical protein